MPTVSKKPKVNVSDNPAEKAGEFISAQFAINFGRPILFVIAGGSSFSVLDHIDPEYLGTNITVVMTDERASEELDVNNFAQLQATHFYNKLVEHDAYCISTELYPGETSGELRDRYDRELKKWKKDFPNGIIIALYGIGEDGHTAGLIPGAYSKKDFDARYDGERMAEEYDAKEKSAFRHRVTTTFSFARDMVDIGVFYVAGASKKDALKRVLAEKGDVHDTPARIMNEMKDANVFTDIKL